MDSTVYTTDSSTLKSYLFLLSFKFLHPDISCLCSSCSLSRQTRLCLWIMTGTDFSLKYTTFFCNWAETQKKSPSSHCWSSLYNLLLYSCFWLLLKTKKIRLACQPLYFNTTLQIYWDGNLSGCDRIKCSYIHKQVNTCP